jgi:GH24 family phage-related lysozyme (muramidase)/uncharacterized protein YvpB
MASSVPLDAIKLIQEFEGCHEYHESDGMIHAYPDPGSGNEPYTIGWGLTVYPDGNKVQPDDKITREQADTFFAIALEKNYWLPISKRVPFWDEMNDAMRSALCSFGYNMGAAFYGNSGCNTITACLREKRWADVPAAFMLYVSPGSPVEVGLRRRRAAEGDLWRSGLQHLSGEAPASAPLVLEAITETFLKKEKLDSSQLAPNQLVAVETGKQWKVEEKLEVEGHSQKVRLAYGAGDWWIYLPHWKEAGTPTPAPAAGAAQTVTTQAVQAGKKDLAVPYLSQLDNELNPYGSCNVTCVAMCLYYLGLPLRTGTQLEDELYRKMEKLGKDRHNPYDLQFLIGTYPGFKDIFRANGTFRDIQTSIDAGNPVIVHGYFTNAGHIIVIRGYDDKGFFVNDPYGEWFSSGYDNNRSGERLHYSYNLIARTCSEESVDNPRHIWYHTVFKV